MREAGAVLVPAVPDAIRAVVAGIKFAALIVAPFAACNRFRMWLMHTNNRLSEAKMPKMP
jgi:hypothetical protein